MEMKKFWSRGGHPLRFLSDPPLRRISATKVSFLEKDTNGKDPGALTNMSNRMVNLFRVSREQTSLKDVSVKVQLY